VERSVSVPGIQPAKQRHLWLDPTNKPPRCVSNLGGPSCADLRNKNLPLPTYKIIAYFLLFVKLKCGFSPTPPHMEKDLGSLHRVGSASDSVQFCMAVLQDIVDHAILLKTSEVWRAAFFPTLSVISSSSPQHVIDTKQRVGYNHRAFLEAGA